MGYMKLESRLKIKAMLSNGLSVRMIAKELGVCRQTVYNELRRGMDENGEYNPDYAEAQMIINQRGKGRTAVLKEDREMSLRISNLILQHHCSIEQVVEILRDEAVSGKGVSPCVNTVYAAIEDGLIPGVTRESLRPNKTKMFSRGMVCIPKWIREKLGFSDGDVFTVTIQNDGTVVLEKRVEIDF